MPSPLNTLTALSPSSVIGIFTTIFEAHLTSLRAWAIISSALVAVTSADTGPDTICVISLITVSKSRPSRDTNVGFVVTPSTKPSSAKCLISSVFAVSKKNFMIRFISFIISFRKLLKVVLIITDYLVPSVIRLARRVRKILQRITIIVNKIIPVITATLP